MMKRKVRGEIFPSSHGAGDLTPSFLFVKTFSLYLQIENPISF
jgi:hypothetical protein